MEMVGFKLTTKIEYRKRLLKQVTYPIEKIQYLVETC